MTFHIETVDHPDFLHLRCTGTSNRGNSSQILDEIFTRFQACPHEKILLDCARQKLETSLNAEYERACYAAELLAGTNHKIAAIGNKEDVYFNHFFETAAVNRGVNVMSFVDEGEAIGWLVGDPLE